jgi:hypothetical protein
MDGKAWSAAVAFPRYPPKVNKNKSFSGSSGLLAEAAQPLLCERLQVVKRR